MKKKSKILSLLLATISLVGFSGCNDIKNKINQTRCDHVMDEVTITIEPTCETAGEKVETCSLCGYEETVILSALGHTYKNVVLKEPTCTKEGEAGIQCITCGDVMIESLVISANGHRKTTILGKDATCMETGLTDGEKCAVCDVEFKQQEVIPKITCTDNNGDSLCDFCGEDIVNYDLSDFVLLTQNDFVAGNRYLIYDNGNDQGTGRTEVWQSCVGLFNVEVTYYPSSISEGSTTDAFAILSYILADNTMYISFSTPGSFMVEIVDTTLPICYLGDKAIIAFEEGLYEIYDENGFCIVSILITSESYFSISDSPHMAIVYKEVK